jgi:hypothetical protein
MVPELRPNRSPSSLPPGQCADPLAQVGNHYDRKYVNKYPPYIFALPLKLARAVRFATLHKTKKGWSSGKAAQSCQN